MRVVGDLPRVAVRVEEDSGVAPPFGGLARPPDTKATCTVASTKSSSARVTRWCSTMEAPFTSSGQVTMVPNPDYSGSPKPTISKLVELPFTSETAIYNQIRAGGPSALTVANLPSPYAPQIPALEAQGYVENKAASYSFNYFPLNFNNPRVGPIFRQLYFRQALQHLVDQPGWIHAFLHDTANPTYGPIPLSPPSPLVNTAPSRINRCGPADSG